MGCYWPGMTLRIGEMTVAQAVKQAGYSTAHFGKWHLSGGKPGAGRPLPADEPLGPGKFGFDEWFSVSNWFDLDWTFSHKGQPEKVAGDGSDAIVAEALKFIGKNAKAETPFLAVIWFGSPHVPLKPRPEDLAAAGGSEYYGELIGVDRSMGTLRKGLRDLNIADDTIIWYTSDNGAWEDENAAPDAFGSNGDLHGHKGELWEGGIRVPGLIEWPARIKSPVRTDVVGCSIDIYPTIVDLLDLDVPGQVQPLDGVSLVPLIDGTMKERPKPIGFWHHGGSSLEGGPIAWMENRFKLFRPKPGDYQLYDLIADPNETKDLAAERPDDLARLKAALEAWQESVRRSNDGADYRQAG
jgi:arylsulfatase A-like enzyme